MSIENLLRRMQAGELSVEETQRLIRQETVDERYRSADLGFARIDLERKDRTGYPEVIYGEGKTGSQISDILKLMQSRESPCLVTRVDEDKARVILDSFPEAEYHQEARIVGWRPIGLVAEQADEDRYIAVVCAGTSDIPVAEEAAVTAEHLGCSVKRIYDVGVAGIHRLFQRLPEIRGASCVVAIAGMEGALVSVVGGLVQAPVVAVPTSVGYGTNLQGLTALLGMLNACSPGIAVVNVDNGFGAGYFASTIVHGQTKR